MYEIITSPPLKGRNGQERVVLMRWPNSAWEYSVGKPPVGGYVDDHRYFGSEETATRFFDLVVTTGIAP